MFSTRIRAVTTTSSRVAPSVGASAAKAAVLAVTARAAAPMALVNRLMLMRHIALPLGDPEFV
jgi:hypothetical protein